MLGKSSVGVVPGVVNALFMGSARSLLQWAALLLLLLSSPQLMAEELPSVAFFYAAHPPVELLSAFDQVVVEAENLTEHERTKLLQSGVELYAYVSLGEVNRSRRWFRDIKPGWKLGENAVWQSVVIDQRQTEWHDYLLSRLQKLWQQRYRGLFLDTLDSFLRVAPEGSEREAQRQGLITLIRAIHQQLPEVKLLFNRGFELLPEVGQQASGMVAESLFRRWDGERAEYSKVPAADREWLLKRLNEAKTRYELPVTVIDYLPPTERQQAREVAAQIRQLGFTPWVSTPQLDYLGIGEVEAVPRRVLLLYDSKQAEVDSALVHRFVAEPLEYLGYSADYVDIQGELPTEPLIGRYAGIVSWFLSDTESPERLRYKRWLGRQLQTAVPIAIFGRFGFVADSQLLKRLGLREVKDLLEAPVRFVKQSNSIGFEVMPRPRSRGLPRWRLDSDQAEPWLRLEDQRGLQIDPVFIAPWGGAALTPYATLTLRPLGDREQASRWYLDPFEFLRQALRLEPMPVGDLSTENGRRLLTVHLDGDGFYSRSQFDAQLFTGDVLLKEIFNRYRLPHTVSIIEGELGPAGLGLVSSEQLEPIARKIFRLPHIEAASHSFSHPYHWQKAVDMVKRARSDVDISKYHLPIKGYHFDLQREIGGSVNYINQRLLPAGKRVKVFLWTGEAIATQEAMALCEAENLLSMNGGNTIITKQHNSLTNVSPSGIPLGSYFQPYAPISNENVYTNNWQGPFYGYRQVIESFELTDQPKRLKPISIYYHFYSGERLASLNALKGVYDWVLQEESFPLWISEYADKVLGFRDLSLARLADGGWRLSGRHTLNTLRLDSSLGWPDLQRSEGVIGVRDLPQGRYLSLDARQRVTLYLSKERPTQPYLQQSNGRVERWQWQPGKLKFAIKGYLPVIVEIANAQQCRLNGNYPQLKTERRGALLQLKFSREESGDVELLCQ